MFNIFKETGFNIEVEMNLNVVQYLDIELNFTNKSVSSKTRLLYVNSIPKHPEVVFIHILSKMNVEYLKIIQT